MHQKRSFFSFFVLMSFATFAVASTSIDAKYKEIGEATLGKPAGREKAAAGGGRVRLYANGGIWRSSATGTHAVYGPTYDKYKSLGGEGGKLGYPVTDVMRQSDGGMQTIFRHGYVLVDKSGAADSVVMSKATFTADSVTLKGMKGKTTQTESLAQFLPETGAGTTFSCNCVTQSGDIGTGSCDIRTRNDVIRCASVNCRNNCRLILVKSAE
jgi:hypothetical protein